MDFTEFYEKHEGFIESCAAKVAAIYDCDGIFSDLLSAGMIAALQQINRYDEQRGAAVTTFLYKHVIGAMRREAEWYHGLPRGERQKEKTVMLSLDDEQQDDLQLASDKSVEEEVYIKICVEHLCAAFDTLSFREREILGGFFGVFGHKKETLAAIGEEFQIHGYPINSYLVKGRAETQAPRVRANN